jgi:hypothetical protein
MKHQLDPRNTVIKIRIESGSHVKDEVSNKWMQTTSGEGIL